MSDDGRRWDDEPSMKQLTLDPDRALPAEPGQRSVARQIYAETAPLPLVCMHGHVDPSMLAEDRPFTDPASTLVTPDHYVTRMLASQGVALEDLGIQPRDRPPVDHDPREIWRRFCAHWHLFRGTPSRYWLEHELAEVFGATVAPSPDSADLLFDEITKRLSQPEFRPRALFERFGIEVLATTDSALSRLDDHASLAADGWSGRVIPTFRPDTVIDVRHPDWPRSIAALADLAGGETDTYAGYIEALRRRRAAFVEAGARATDHSPATVDTTRLSDAEAGRLYDAALRGDIDPARAAAFTGHMLHVMAEMSCDDGLVMQLHPGIIRDHDSGALARYGTDLGYDIPVSIEFARALRPLLESFGHHRRFRLIVYTVDETTYSRELAPLAGVYPAVRLGAPWWFLDSPDGMRRFRELVTETAGFYNTAGFVDDTRAFPSIPARHDLARRIDAGYLARLVTEHRLDLDEAVETAADLAYHLPRDAYAVG